MELITETTFPNNIKHRIYTHGDKYLTMYSYRYLYVHKEEGKDQTPITLC